MPTAITPAQIIQYAAYLVLLIIAGTLEYFKILPVDSTAGLFLLIVGHFFGNVPTSNALARNTKARSTPATPAHAANTIAAPTGPIHLIHHYETPPAPASPPLPTTEPIEKASTGPIPAVKVQLDGSITTQVAAAALSTTPGPINFGETAKTPVVQAPQ